MGPIRKSLNIIKDKFPKNLFNKYLLAFVIFLIWMIFFDSNRVISQWSLQKSVNELEKEKIGFEEAIVQIKEDKIDIDQNKEKFAREKYYMHKENEDVFIIEKPEKK